MFKCPLAYGFKRFLRAKSIGGTFNGKKTQVGTFSEKISQNFVGSSSKY